MLVEEQFRKLEKAKTGRRGQWQKHLADDLVDIILDNDIYKEKLILTNIKNVGPVQDGVEEQKGPPYQFFPCTSTNVGISPQNF